MPRQVVRRDAGQRLAVAMMRKLWRVHCRDSQASSPRRNSSATPRRSLTVESQRISSYPRGGPLQVRPRTSRPSSASPSRVSFLVATPFQTRALGGSREGTPRWSRDGRALYYRGPDNRIMVVECTATGESFSAATPRVWSPTPVRATAMAFSPMDLAPQGSAFCGAAERGAGGREGLGPRDLPTELLRRAASAATVGGRVRRASSATKEEARPPHMHTVPRIDNETRRTRFLAFLAAGHHIGSDLATSSGNQLADPHHWTTDAAP